MPKPEDRYVDVKQLRLDVPASRGDLLKAVRAVFRALRVAFPERFAPGELDERLEELKQEILGE